MAQAAEPMAVDEDDLLQQALAMSMAGEPMETQAAAPAPAEQPAPAAGSMFDSYDEELQNAIRMSMSEVQPGEDAPPAAGPVSSTPPFGPSFWSLLSSFFLACCSGQVALLTFSA